MYGYLKPDTFKRELATGRGEIFFVRVFHLAYLIVAICLIVNFLITIINEVYESKGKKKLGDDALAYLHNRLTEKLKTLSRRKSHWPKLNLKRYYNILASRKHRKRILTDSKMIE